MPLISKTPIQIPEKIQSAIEYPYLWVNSVNIRFPDCNGDGEGFITLTHFRVDENGKNELYPGVDGVKTLNLNGIYQLAASRPKLAAALGAILEAIYEGYEIQEAKIAEDARLAEEGELNPTPE